MGFRGRVPADSRENFDAARDALLKLIDFRREHEHLFISDYIAAATSENRGLEIDALLDGEFIKAETPAVAGMLMPWGNWYFRRDPEDRGTDGRWFQSGQAGISDYDDGTGRAFRFDVNQWIPVRVPARLAETAVGDYLGYGWYATTFQPPDEWEGKPVELHFEAVDEQAWVYVNGEYVGEHTVASEELGIGDLWDRPFKIEIPAGLIRTGEENLLVVRTHASAGAAGIWGPVGAIKAE